MNSKKNNQIDYFKFEFSADIGVKMSQIAFWGSQTFGIQGQGTLNHRCKKFQKKTKKH